MPDNNNGKSYSRHFKSSSLPKTTGKQEGDEIFKNPASSKWLRRLVLEVNKFPYSNSKNVGLYSFSRAELEWYYKEIRLLADKVLDILECPHCGDTIESAAFPGCGCDNPLACCSKCVLDVGSVCLNCKRHCSSLSFEPVDDIVRECRLFFKEKAFTKGMLKCSDRELSRLCESYQQFLKQSEMQLMCNFCFGTLEKAMTVNFGGELESRTQVCEGCHVLYMECYKCCTDASPYPTFDRLNSEFSQFFNKILAYCRQNKSQVYKDPYPDSRQPSLLRLKALKHQGGKGRLYGVFKKALVFAACAYLFVYFVQ